MAMDLSLLPHLSERALREEAERRGVDAEGLGRDELIAAIRAREGRAMTVPPAHGPTAYAPTVPPEPADPKKGPLAAARGLLDRVVGLARSALDRKSEPPPEPAEAEEPIRTRSMARLLEQQGHLERALAIVRELGRAERDPELDAWAATLERAVNERALRERMRARLESAAGSRVELEDAGATRAVAWRIDDAGLERARALLRSHGALTLRVIRVVALADHGVESRQEDRRPLEASGWAQIEAPANARLVVSVGLAEGERFVSIAHAAR